LLLNLVVNAVQHAGAGGVVSLTVDEENARACCEIRDSGPGILTGDLDRIFDRFRRADPSGDGYGSAGRSRGTGLGLAISRSIAEAHGGQIRVRNDDGAVFTVELPTGGGRL
jgi:two-component system heavy metal sensor histidine kinase CusS